MTHTKNAARQLLLRELHGVLSTHSVELPGYPFGSLVPYCLDRQGWPVILISRIAQHTKNIDANSKVALTVAEPGTEDVQAGARLTIVGDAEPVGFDGEDSAERYYRYFPHARGYHRTHDFSFYHIRPVRSRYIGGFGEIHWLSNEALVLANPFTAEAEAGMLEHMNRDHQDAIRHYCERSQVAVPTDAVPAMAGIDGEGFHVRVDDRLIRIAFDQPATTPPEVRAALVAMARR
jgi:hypothetical protein